MCGDPDTQRHQGPHPQHAEDQQRGGRGAGGGGVLGGVLFEADQPPYMNYGCTI